MAVTMIIFPLFVLIIAELAPPGKILLPLLCSVTPQRIMLMLIRLCALLEPIYTKATFRMTQLKLVHRERTHFQCLAASSRNLLVLISQPPNVSPEKLP